MDHGARRARLTERLAELGTPALLVTTTVNVRYLTGFTGSNGQLLVGPGASVFFTDSRYEEQASHEAPDVERRTYARDFLGALAEVCGDRGIDPVGFEAHGVTYDLYRRLEEADGIAPVPVGPEVERLRWAKDEEELRRLERAQELTDDAFDRVVGKLSEGVTEQEVALELEQAMRRAGAERLAFDPIVAFGESAAEPHHHPSGRPLARGEVVKLDFGCVVDGYHSDMSRTVAFGKPDDRLREVYEVVRRAQLAGVEALRAGVTGDEADRAARGIIEEAQYGERFGHSLGHGVGLEIHEGPTLRTGSEDTMPEGAVVTVEPGVYLPGVGGVRIEDAVVVTADGARPLPRTTKELVSI